MNIAVVCGLGFSDTPNTCLQSTQLKTPFYQSPVRAKTDPNCLDACTFCRMSPQLRALGIVRKVG
eukprot:28917-Amphidinium_carterae.1